MKAGRTAVSHRRTVAAMEIELSSVLGREVDLRTRGELSRYFRDQVLRNSEVQFGP